MKRVLLNINVFLLLSPFAQGAPICGTATSSEVVANIVQHEMDAARSQGRWMYTARYILAGVHIEARAIQTNDGLLTWVISRDGKALSAEERKKQEDNLKQQVVDPAFLSVNRRAMHDDAMRINSLLQILPEAVQFECISQNGPIGTVHFMPKPGYSPLNVNRRIIAGMSGSLTLNLKDMRLVAASGSEHDDISILLGIAHIYKGSSVTVSRAEVAPGIWETTAVSTHISGKAFLFKTIAQDRDETRTDFVAVRSDLLAGEAIRLLIAGSIFTVSRME